MMLIIKVLLIVLVSITTISFIFAILSYESDLKRKANQLKDQAKHEIHDHYIFTDAGPIRITYDYED